MCVCEAAITHPQTALRLLVQLLLCESLVVIVMRLFAVCELRRAARAVIVTCLLHFQGSRADGWPKMLSRSQKAQRRPCPSHSQTRAFMRTYTQ